MVDYEELPAVVDTRPTRRAPARRALCAEAPDNIAAEMRHGDADGGRRRRSPRAAHVVALDIVNQRLAPSPIEPRCVLADVDAGERPPARCA